MAQPKYFQNLFVILFASILLLAAALQLAPVWAQAESVGETVCRLPVGADGISYAGEGQPEMLVWGPPAFTIAPDGSYWIADTAANRLLHVSSDCRLLAAPSLDGLAVGVSDLKVTGQEVWALDSSSPTPAVLRLGLDGKLMARFDLPAELAHGLSGLTVSDDGLPLIEQEGGAWWAKLLDDQGLPAVEAVAGFTHNDQVYRTQPGETAGPLPNQGWLHIGELSVLVETSSKLGGLRLAGFGAAGEIYLQVEEVALVDGAIQVDQTVRRYSPQGELLDQARVPLAGQYTYVQHGLAAGPDGAMYAFVTRQDGAEIVRLGFQEQIDHILPLDPGEEGSLSEPALADPAAVETISPATMISNAWGYINNSRYLSATNTDGACAERTKPRYLGGAGTYSSVSYDWGGADSVAEFNGYMSPNTYQAGDISEGNSIACSRGVDCSGFVQRVWGLPALPKYSTTTLPNISTQLASVGQLWRGDILNLYNSHVVLFAAFAPNGVYAFESTPNNSVDRVVYAFSTWSRLVGYVPRRYTSYATDICSGQYRAEYYNNRTLSGRPAITACEGWPINHDWGSGGPGTGVGVDNFSARWVGRANFTAGTYTFIATADDGVRIWLDDRLIIDKWIDQSPTEYRYTTSVAAGYHNIQVDYYENGGGAVAKFRWELSTSVCPTITAWKGEYWNNMTLYGTPTLCRNDASVNFDWGGGSPAANIPADRFSARWTRSMYFNAGTYRFHVRSDDGVRLWLDNTLIIDKWIDQGPTEYTADRSLAAGNHSLKIEYYENGGGAVAQYWHEQLSTSSGNLALNKPASATSIQGTGYEAYRGNDGNTGTRWSSRISTTLGDQWWIVDLGTQTFDRVVIRWEAAYAASHFVGWSNDKVNFTGYWYSISAPGAYSYNLSSRTARYVGILMRTRAPLMNNYSFWEAEVYRTTTTATAEDDATPIEPVEGPVEINLTPASKIHLPLIVR